MGLLLKTTIDAQHTIIRDNLPKEEREVIKNLQNRVDIAIKSADKGSGTVVMGYNSYINECFRQLNDNKYYQKQTKDTTNKIQEKIKLYTSRLFNENLIDDNTYKYLTCNPKPKAGLFYILPKNHKVGNPGRPII